MRSSAAAVIPLGTAAIAAVIFAVILGSVSSLPIEEEEDHDMNARIVNGEEAKPGEILFPTGSHD